MYDSMKRLFFTLACLVGIPAIGQAQNAKPSQAAGKSKPEAKMPVAKPATAASTPAKDPDKVKVKGYQPPAFPGGEKKMHEFIAQNLNYPAKAKTAGLEGEVFVKVTVKKDGSLGLPKVVSGLDAECDKEAVRVVAAMPKWIPGQRDDEPIEANYTIPVRFMVQ